MINFGTNKNTIIQFIIINIFVKSIPLYNLRNKKIKLKDIYFTIFLFIVFLLWLNMNEQTLIGNQKLIYDSFLYSENKTPLMSLFHKFKNNFKNL
jgi:hypothetical protein